MRATNCRALTPSPSSTHAPAAVWSRARAARPSAAVRGGRENHRPPRAGRGKGRRRRRIAARSGARPAPAQSRRPAALGAGGRRASPSSTVPAPRRAFRDRRTRSPPARGHGARRARRGAAASVRRLSFALARAVGIVSDARGANGGRFHPPSRAQLDMLPVLTPVRAADLAVTEHRSARSGGAPPRTWRRCAALATRAAAAPPRRLGRHDRAARRAGRSDPGKEARIQGISPERPAVKGRVDSREVRWPGNPGSSVYWIPALAAPDSSSAARPE